jgi:hypothetical protein
MKHEERIDFLGQIMDAIGKPVNPPNNPGVNAVENVGLPFINIGPDGLNLWVKQKFILISMPEYLEETKTRMNKSLESDVFPLNVIPKDLLTVLSTMTK